MAGCDDYSDAVEVLPAPTAGFTYTVEGLAAAFTNTSSGATAYLWSFGDGITATVEHPVHTYAAGGSYDVTLLASNSSCSDEFSATLVVTECDPVEIITITPAISGCVATFAADLTGTTPYEYSWDMGAFGTYTEAHPVVDFSTSGTYAYTLTTFNCDRTYSDTLAGQVTVSCETPCDPVSQADFTWVPTLPMAGQAVTFTASASGTAPITYSWDLGNGDRGLGRVITTSYDLPGVYAVTLTASNCGGATAVVTHPLNVVAPPPSFSAYLPLVLRGR